ncbi:MAG: TIM barrel protein [Candidatus Margulisiibacteriota bacterium]
MFNYGLKLWSTNRQYLPEARRLFQKGTYQFLELYVVPETINTLPIWLELKNEGVPVIIHAPHYGHGLNLAVPFAAADNQRLAGEAFRFADDLGSEIVIFHPGIGGTEAETVRQLKLLADRRIVIENKPYVTVDGQKICNGHSPEAIALIVKETGAGFCLDLGHAICSANAQRREPFAYLKEFIALKPKLFHLTDGDSQSDRDSHRHFGRGNYDLPKLLALIPAESKITVETIKSDPASLNDFVADLEVLKHV